MSEMEAAVEFKRRKSLWSWSFVVIVIVVVTVLTMIVIMIMTMIIMRQRLARVLMVVFGNENS